MVVHEIEDPYGCVILRSERLESGDFLRRDFVCACVRGLFLYLQLYLCKCMFFLFMPSYKWVLTSSYSLIAL